MYRLTMHEMYGDGSTHACCPTCELCLDCGDCDCNPLPPYPYWLLASSKDFKARVRYKRGAVREVSRLDKGEDELTRQRKLELLREFWDEM